jgi:very-short-patch-repair endonuclease
MAAVLSCGPESALSHGDAGALYGIRPITSGLIHLSVPASVHPRRPGLVIHRRGELDITKHRGIPVTTPASTLIDLATQLDRDQVEAAINEADNRNLIDPEQLRSVLDEMSPGPGRGPLRDVLDRRTFRRTDSWLERRFLAIARRVGLPAPLTQQYVSGFRVDFLWPDLRLVVETDSLRYHRTPAQQARDHLRDQAHIKAGLTPLRFTHEQVAHDPGYVEATLAAVARLLRSAP